MITGYLSPADAMTAPRVAAPAYTSPMPHVYPWAPTQIADRTYEVKTARVYDQEISIGEQFGYGCPVTHIWFYTGYIATERQTVIANATGLTGRI